MPKKEKALLYNGKPFTDSTFRPSIERIKLYFDKHSNAGVFSPNEFANFLRINPKTVRDFCYRYTEYCYKFGPRMVVGHPKEIKRFKLLLSGGENK